VPAAIADGMHRQTLADPHHGTLQGLCVEGHRRLYHLGGNQQAGRDDQGAHSSCREAKHIRPTVLHALVSLLRCRCAAELTSRNETKAKQGYHAHGALTARSAGVHRVNMRMVGTRTCPDTYGASLPYHPCTLSGCTCQLQTMYQHQRTGTCTCTCNPHTQAPHNPQLL
jgi:hypothetical protein